MQKWEYRVENIRRWLDYSGLKLKWESWTQDFDFAELGMEGWELVAAYPIATQVISDCAGMTNQVQFVFKRPMEE